MLDDKLKACKTSEEMAQVIVKAMEGKEILRLETCPCDSYGWSKDVHTRMEKIHRKGLLGKDIHIKKSYKFEVYDWELVRD
jgi:hypothetical protein